MTVRSSPARGMVLIAAAVVLGLFLLRAIDDSSTPVSSGDLAETAGTAGAGADTTAPPAEGEGSTTTETPARPPAEVTVRVANASGVQGAAGAKTEQLAGGGYQTVGETNGPQGQRIEATQVLFTKGFDREAVAVAEALGLPAENAAALPAQPPVDLGGAQILVLLGTDIAQT
ncbi:MAG: LytR C-terminal domain-containing protein [Acidimicrobiales bacterium]